MTAPTRSPLLAAFATVTAAMSLLAGCTGGTPAPAPTATTTSQAGTTPSASATPTTAVAEAPQWTEDMDQVSLDAALAVGRYFLELYPYVIETGDTTEWDRLSHPDCIFCADTAEFARTREPTDERVTVAILTGEGEELDPAVYYALTFQTTTSSSVDGVARPGEVKMGLVRENDRWLVRAVEPIESVTK
ncbi:DUF6318 family protein [Cellulomonas soli]|uniref:DUF6318 domain-containing protein n=1 Tax=Cellulomonas soli TaxID=931535 RepID=A0A512PGA9_9CELL|nr:DUF6318 family protein [Cellulomonas soli]NYI58096.1 hypothetical protein [Cellulomonas soli]GEP70231.1 hypothetical protein CSO01_29460 [Cellulomonas soli]